VNLHERGPYQNKISKICLLPQGSLKDNPFWTFSAQEVFNKKKKKLEQECVVLEPFSLANGSITW